jgi:Na+/H+ antiporter NhaD/arsenite permease-like protein
LHRHCQNGVIVLLVSGTLDIADIGAALDLPTLALLFAQMILAERFAAAHYFNFIGAWPSRVNISSMPLLGLVGPVSGLVSMVLASDIVLFGFTPLLGIVLRDRCSGRRFF